MIRYVHLLFLRVKGFYKDQKNAMISSAEKWLTGLAEWHEPVAGMFLWMKLNGIHDTHKLIMEKAIQNDVNMPEGVNADVKCGNASDNLRFSIHSVASRTRADMDLVREFFYWCSD
jgi:kynurenine/2-aminoadipate aminotransferase